MPRKSRLTNEIINGIIQCYKEGHNCAEVGRVFGIVKSHVREILIKNQVEIRRRFPRSPELTEDLIEKWIEDYKNGKKTSEIAKDFSVAKSTVWKELRKNGVMKDLADSKKTITDEEEEEIVALYQLGLSIKDCSREMRMSAGIIKRALQRNKIVTVKGRRLKFKRKEDQKRICNLFLQGWSVSELCTELDCKKDDVIGVLRLSGIKIKLLKRPKGHLFVDKSRREFSMKSLWEIQYAKYLDANNVEWDYKSKEYPIGSRIFTPSFMELKQGKLYRVVEVKGWYSSEEKRRVKLFKEMYPEITIVIYREHHLRRLGIL